MAQAEKATNGMVSVDEIQHEWSDLKLKVRELDAERRALEVENKSLRALVERVIEHRQKSHGELVLLLTALVSKLPINDVGVVVSRLVEHNAHCAEVLAALSKGTAEGDLPQPAVLKALDETKRELLAALKPAVEEMIKQDTSFETDMLRALVEQPELFFSPSYVRAVRCYVKGQVMKERVVKEFGEPALVFFNDVTTDPKLNPNPKPEEIALAFKPDFEAWFQQNPNVLPEKRNDLMALYQKIQRGKSSEHAHTQRFAFARLTFLLELLHFYDNQSTEAPDVVFAGRMPGLVEQMVLTGLNDKLDEKLISDAEKLIALVLNPDHRHAIINNTGKGGGVAKTLKFVLKLREEKVQELDDTITDFVKHLIPSSKVPPLDSLTPILRLIKPEMQRLLAITIMDYDKLRKEDAEILGKAIGKELGLSGLDVPRKIGENIPAEVERQMAWDKIKEMVARRHEPAAIATAIRERLHAKYDADEMKQSWVTLIEFEPITFIRVFCQIPYLPDGKTDSIAQAVIESYVTRLTHEKYASAYAKVVTSLKNMYKANPNAPMLVNFMALVRWVDAEAARQIGADIGMPV